jgi:hypothetical protein
MLGVSAEAYVLLAGAIGLISRRTGGDGLLLLAVMCASGRLQGEGVPFRIDPRDVQEERRGLEHTGISDSWWAEIRPADAPARSSTELTAITNISAENNTISRMELVTTPWQMVAPVELPPRLIPLTYGFRHVRFRHAHIDRLWPEPAAEAQKQPKKSSPSGPSPQRQEDKPPRIKFDEIVECARQVANEFNETGRAWWNIDIDLVPLVKDRLPRAPRDDIRAAFRTEDIRAAIQKSRRK